MEAVTYDEGFFDAEDASALTAAEIVLPAILARLDVGSVIDVGCGTGAWGSVAEKLGCDVLGVDGYGDGRRLTRFEKVDLSEGYDCKRFDLAICLEVAEHLPAESAPALVAGLCKAKAVLFSAAIPDQGGVGHVNEQWPQWWAAYFAAHSMVPTDAIRDEHWNDQRIADFYRQNLLLFAPSWRMQSFGYIAGYTNRVHPDLARAKGWDL